MRSCSETAERALISLALDNPEIYFHADQKGVHDESFADPQRQRIWRFIRTASTAGKKPDRLMVACKVEASKSERCMAEFALIPDSGDVLRHHAQHYIEEVLRDWKRWRFKQLQAEASEKMKEGEEPDVVSHWLASELVQLESSAINVHTVDSLESEVRDIWDEAAKGNSVGVPSCMPWFNRIAGCYRRKLVTGIGATTNAGKSTLAKMEALYCGIELQRPVCLITPEDSRDMVLSSMVGISKRMNTFALDMGMARADRAAGIEGLTRLKGHPIYIVDQPMTGELLEATMTLMKARYGVELIIIDHLHYVREPTIPDPRLRCSHLMGIISGATKTLEVSTLMFAQLSRESNKTGRPPRLSDFKESGDIENEIRTGGMMWVDPNTGYRVIHLEKCKGYGDERRLIYLKERSNNVPGFDEVPFEDWPDDEATLDPGRQKEKGQWKRK